MTLTNKPFITMAGAMLLAFTSCLVFSQASFALPKKDTVYNECACLCGGPGQGGIIDIQNNAGLPCGAYNNKTCNYEDPATGGVRSATTQFCTAYKPGGVKGATMLPRTGTRQSVLSRGVEGESPTAESEKASTDPAGEVQERAVSRQGLSGRSLSFTGCGCKNGSGTCTVSTSPVPGGDSQTCQKGAADTCTGTCDFSWVKSSGGRLRPQ